MEDNNTLSEKILDKLRWHEQELVGRQQQIDNSMKEMLDRREQQAVITKHAIDTIVLPRMQELVSHFDNAKVNTSSHADAVRSCVCEFTHTPRFPATVRLSITLLPFNDSVTARYSLEIFPILMEFEGCAEKEFRTDFDKEALAAWVEQKILEFLDTYLRLKTNPFYQKDNTVIDIVCGMRIPFVHATSSIERNGRTFYFCSEHCKDAFVKESNS